MKKFECIVDQTRLRAKNGVMRTEGLFWENSNRINGLEGRLEAQPVYTLKDYEHKGYPSMYEVYMDCSTEYEAAKVLLGSWRHWKKLCDVAFFQPYITEWREERRCLEEALAHTAILSSIELDGNVSAAKSILDAGKRKGAGRPTKIEVNGEMAAAIKEEEAYASIVDRMRNDK